jgi:hypothetical protein
MQEASTIDTIKQLLAEGRIRQYGGRKLIAHLARKHRHRSRQDDVLTALRILDDYGVTRNEEKWRDDYVVPGPDWLWYRDGHDKLSRFGIKIYGCVDATASGDQIPLFNRCCYWPLALRGRFGSGRFISLENKASAETNGNKDLAFGVFLHEFLNAVKGVLIRAAFRDDRGN